MLLDELYVKQRDLDDILPSVGLKREYFCKLFLEYQNVFENVLYIHNPFCPRKCRYCHCQSMVTNSKEEVNEFYYKLLPAHFALYGELMSHVHFDQVYFGGGTPTYADTDMLEFVFNSIPYFSEIDNKCIEASPSTLSREHLYLFQKYKFKFLSMGIQSLSQDVLKRENRDYVAPYILKEISKILRGTGMYFNFDLICFLDKGDVRDLQRFKNELTFILQECTPSCVTIHQCYQSVFTVERTLYLIEMLNDVLAVVYKLRSNRVHDC